MAKINPVPFLYQFVGGWIAIQAKGSGPKRGHDRRGVFCHMSQQPASIDDVVLGLQLDRACNLVALNWPVLSPQQKARVLAAIPREEWPK